MHIYLHAHDTHLLSGMRRCAQASRSAKSTWFLSISSLLAFTAVGYGPWWGSLVGQHQCMWWGMYVYVYACQLGYGMVIMMHAPRNLHSFGRIRTAGLAQQRSQPMHLPDTVMAALLLLQASAGLPPSDAPVPIDDGMITGSDVCESAVGGRRTSIDRAGRRRPILRAPSIEAEPPQFDRGSIHACTWLGWKGQACLLTPSTAATGMRGRRGLAGRRVTSLRALVARSC